MDTKTNYYFNQRFKVTFISHPIIAFFLRFSSMSDMLEKLVFSLRRYVPATLMLKCRRLTLVLDIKDILVSQDAVQQRNREFLISDAERTCDVNSWEQPRKKTQQIHTSFQCF